MSRRSSKLRFLGLGIAVGIWTSLVSSVALGQSQGTLDTPYTSNLPECKQYRKKCGADDPKTLGNFFIDQSRKLVDLLQSETDKAILKCSGSATKQILNVADACYKGSCLGKNALDVMKNYSDLSCNFTSCLSSIQGVKKNPYVIAAKAVCSSGKDVAKAIECFGTPVFGGGLLNLCETAIKNAKPVQLQECPSAINPSVQACASSGPAPLEDISRQCEIAVANLKSQRLITDLQQGKCTRKCIDTTVANSKSCRPTVKPCQSGGVYVSATSGAVLSTGINLDGSGGSVSLDGSSGVACVHKNCMKGSTKVELSAPQALKFFVNGQSVSLANTAGQYGALQVQFVDDPYTDNSGGYNLKLKWCPK